MSEPLLLEKIGHIAVVTLNMPETRNALNGDACFLAFETIFEDLNQDMEIRAIVLTGAGSAFCSGGNVADMRDKKGMFAGTAEQVAENYRIGIQRIPRAFEKLHVPIIAAVNGPAIGAGNDLACMCDIRIASTNAKFAESFVKVGIIPGDGGCWFLPRAVGYAKAAEMIFTGETLDATEALRIGLVTAISTPEQLMHDSLALAHRVAANPPGVLRWSKQLLRQAQMGSLDEALKLAGHFQGQAHQTADHAEAVAAFFEKRMPQFKGN